MPRPPSGHDGVMTYRYRTAAVATALALAVPAALAETAEAATWSTIQTSDGAKLQGCKVKLTKGWRLRLRLVNSSDHGHQAGVSVRRDGELVDRAYFKVVKRGTSRVKAVKVRSGDTLSAGMAEADDSGGGGGGEFSLGTIKKC